MDHRVSHFTRKHRNVVDCMGDDIHGNYISKQPVVVLSCTDEDEDIWAVVTVDGKDHRVDGDTLNPHPEARQTNVEFMTLMMDWSTTALVQAMVMQATEQFAKTVLTATDEEIGGATAFVHPAAWREAAREILGWFAAREMAEQLAKEQAPAG